MASGVAGASPGIKHQTRQQGLPWSSAPLPEPMHFCGSALQMHVEEAAAEVVGGEAVSWVQPVDFGRSSERQARACVKLQAAQESEG